MKQKNKYVLSSGCQEMLEKFYSKYKNICAFGRYPQKLAFETIIYQSLQYMDAMLPIIHKNQENEQGVITNARNTHRR